MTFVYASPVLLQQLTDVDAQTFVPMLSGSKSINSKPITK